MVTQNKFTITFEAVYVYLNQCVLDRRWKDEKYEPNCNKNY